MSPRARALINWFSGSHVSRMPDLGAREIEVLDMLWASGPASAQDIRDGIGGKPVSLSTIQSTLERLHRKQLVERSKQGRAYRYDACLSRSQLIGALLRGLSDEIAGGELAPMVSGFMDYVAAEDPALETDLKSLLADKDAGDA